MTKQRFTKKQLAVKRQTQLREQADLAKLLKQRPKIVNRDISVNAIPTYEYDDPVQARSMPSAHLAPTVTQPKVEYEDNSEMALREALAQKEKDRKRTRLAPAYNKGPVMYITDETNLTELGRKI